MKQFFTKLKTIFSPDATATLNTKGNDESEKKEENLLNRKNDTMYVKKISTRDLKGMVTVLQKLRKIEAEAKGINRKHYNFKINKKYTIYIEEGGLHSFTFLISRRNRNSKLENLVLISGEGADMGYRMYLIQYSLGRDDIKGIKNIGDLELVIKDMNDITIAVSEEKTTLYHNYVVKTPALLLENWSRYGSWIRLNITAARNLYKHERKELMNGNRHSAHKFENLYPVSCNPEDESTIGRTKKTVIITTPVTRLSVA